jgi:hypothetical protein
MKAPQLPGKYEVKSEVVINASTAAVWNVLKEFGSVSDWAPSVGKSYYLDSQTSGVGTGRHCDIDGLGSIDEVVTDWQEGVGFTYSVTPLGPLDKSNSSWRLSRISDRETKLEVTFNYDLRFGLLGKILHKLVMRRKLEQSLPETLAAFEQRLATVLSSEPLAAVPVAA